MENIKEIITLDFLNKLKEVAKQYGWRGDYTEIKDFVQWCYEEKGEKIDLEMDLEAYG